MAIDPPAAPSLPELADLDPAFDLSTFATENETVREPLRRADAAAGGHRLERGDRRADSQPYERPTRLTDSGIQLVVAGLLALGAIAIVILALRGRQLPVIPTPTPPSASAPAAAPGTKQPAPVRGAASEPGGSPGAPAARTENVRTPAAPASPTETRGRANASESSRTAAASSPPRKPQTPAVGQSTISVNAKPWANVWLDGRQIGETPLANVRVRAGTHEIVFRHPQLGERRVRATVRAGEPARVTADLRR